MNRRTASNAAMTALAAAAFACLAAFGEGTFTVGCVNCGAFRYGNGRATATVRIAEK